MRVVEHRENEEVPVMEQKPEDTVVAFDESSGQWIVKP